MYCNICVTFFSVVFSYYICQFCVIPSIYNYVLKKRLLKSVTYFRSVFKVFYYCNICQFCFIQKKYQGVILYAMLDIVYIYSKVNNQSSHVNSFPYNEQMIDPSSPTTTEWRALEFETVINKFDGFYHKLMKK